MIEINQVSKEFKLNKKQQKELNLEKDVFCAVDDVSFICKPGRVFSLLGPNGAGKTTLLRMIATILQRSKGEIFVDKISVTKDPEKVRSKIGFLTGSTNLYERLSAEEIVKYFADLHGMNTALFQQRKKQLFDQLEINSFAHKKISDLSTGMKQRVSIARSMIHNPSVVIFDEPTSGLDVITASHIIDLIKQCKVEQKTIIFSSHIMSEVELLCDDLAIIANGKLIYNDTLENFKNERIGNSLTESFIYRVNEASSK